MKLIKNYKYDARHPNVLVFGFGKRIFPGEMVAIAELYVFIAELILRYRIKSTIDPEHLEIRTRCDLTQAVYPQIDIKFERR